ncbi:hypothetical protein [Microbacterium sp. PAMC22086]|uniref:hypothetical protein n=1 Tax=Microbacterium sp. PAMC22086 TaxID=2861281 RepID=UPI001C62FC8B|nr:hypothetical protein [Microbacterium sp. PAMC22086]QYG12881.1 hypothetical protein KY497_06410 [Microbacterium sp. PAMC22086]
MSITRPRVYIDENLPHQIAGSLARAFRSAIFSSHKDEKLTGVLDLPLFEQLQDREFDAIITRDIAQSITTTERDGLRAAGLHWVGVREPKSAAGLAFHGAILSSVAATIPTLLAGFASTPRAYFVECEHLKWQQPIRVEPL